MGNKYHREGYRHDNSLDKIGDKAKAAIEEVIEKNGVVGSIIGYFDDALSILSASEYLLHNLGYTKEQFEQFTGGSLRRLLYGENVHFAEKDRFRRIQGAGEGKMLTGDGAPVTVLLYKVNSEDADGVPIWVMSVRVDWEHENLALINEALRSGSWYMDCDLEGNITTVNWSHSFRRLLGYRDILDFPNVFSSWSELLHPDEREQVLARLYAALQDRTNATKYDVEYRMRMQDGSYHWFHAVAEITRRLDGTARRIGGAFINIDKEKKSEAMEHLLRSVSRVVDHFAVCDLENDHCDYVNMTLQTDYPAEGRYSDFIEIVLQRFKTLEPLPPLRELLTPANFREKLRREEDVFKFEYCSLQEDVYRIASFIPISWENGVLTSVLWTSTDITRAKRDEIASRKALKDAYLAADRANRAKTEFLSNMSHDIRTPMNAIVGMTAIAGANIEHTDRVLECLGKITASSRHLLALINEVLDMARIESGKVSLSEEEFNLSQLIDNLLAMVKPGIEEHHHHFEVHLRSLAHEDVCGDSLRIQQIFVNLVSNAVKYTPDGGNIVFSIEEKPNGRSGLGCYEFSVEDNGIGMTSEFQKVMFEPFTRADDQRTTKIQGTGLGMAVTKNIVQMMNGDIRVESAPNRGTKITVTVFLKLQDKGTDRIKELQDLPVLVADDDRSCCESTVAILKEIGIAGEWVQSGAEAVARTLERHRQKDDFFAVIMDWKMPGMDGIEATRQIRDQIGSDVTIIVLTAYDYHEILLLDEPTTYLDVRYQLQILRLVKQLNEKLGITVLMVLHDINQALAYSDEIVALSPEGRLVAQGDPQQVITPETLRAMYGIDLQTMMVEGKKMVLTV